MHARTHTELFREAVRFYTTGCDVTVFSTVLLLKVFFAQHVKRVSRTYSHFQNIKLADSFDADRQKIDTHFHQLK